MIKKNNIYIKALLLLFTVVMSLPTVFAQEGSGNWKGSQTGRQSSLYVPTNSSTANEGYGARGYMMLPSSTNGYDPGHRFYVYLKAGETVYYSFRANNSSHRFKWYYDARPQGIKEKFPAGTSGQSRTEVTVANSELNGFDGANNNLTQAQAGYGPRPLVGNSGYPIGDDNGGSFKNNTGEDRAFWLEFNSSYGFEIPDWDVTVASNGVQQKGRVYSKYWSIYNGLPSTGSVNSSAFHDNFGFFVPVDNTYSEDNPNDYYIKYVNFGKSNAGWGVFFANDSGPHNNKMPNGDPDIEGNRKSIKGTSNRFQYPLFVADPDPTIWTTSLAPISNTNVRFKRKADATGGEAYFTVTVDTPGTLDILLDLDDSGGYSDGDVQIF